jgi:hypothetical protein
MNVPTHAKGMGATARGKPQTSDDSGMVRSYADQTCGAMHSFLASSGKCGLMHFSYSRWFFLAVLHVKLTPHSEQWNTGALPDFSR